MKPASRTISRRALSCGALALLLAGSASAQTTLLTDSFDTVGVGGAFNDSGALAADQTGTLAPLSYSRVVTGFGWEGFVQRGNGAEMLLAGNDGSYNGQVFASLDHNFAADANTLNSPLEIKFNLVVTDSANDSNWGTIALGTSQNQFVNDTANKFSSLFRDNGGTQQFASGPNIGDDLFQFVDGDEITLLLSDTAGTGSAFNGNGSVAKMYVNGDLKATFTDLGLGANDGYISFQAYGTKARYNNLAITATAATVPSDYDTWAESFTPPIGLPAADDDNDGLSNEQEYAFGLLPDSGASVNPIVAPLDQATGTFSYTRRDSTLTPLNYSVWFSTDLAAWTEDIGATEGVPVLNGEVETVPVTLSALPGDPLPAKLFIQVRAD
jgi:hypothetical protein